MYLTLAYTLGGLIAGEGCFSITTKQPPFKDGTERLRFVFSFVMAERDAALVSALRAILGYGSVQSHESRKGGWLPFVRLTVNSITAHRASTIPFCERFLPPTQKRRQFAAWRDQLDEFDLLHPNRYGKGPSTCRVDGCPNPVRGRGLCRSHYYRVTGY